MPCALRKSGKASKILTAIKGPATNGSKKKKKDPKEATLRFEESRTA